MTRNKKGFTLVELVIVIAVIAILAGVMIAVFSGVVKRANESAELQKIKNEELAQKADDILKKVDNSNWFSWEDFENSLAEKLTAEYKRYANNDQTITPEIIQKTVKEALEDYAKNTVADNTSLTEAQVKAIVENAVAKASLGGVTEAQVRTIVNTAVAGISTVSKAQVQAIVDAAVAKGLTADQVAQVIATSGLAKASDLTAVSAKVDTAIAAINALNPVTKQDVADAIIDLVPVTYTINTIADFEDAIARVNSFSTLVFTSEYPSTTVTITLPAGDDRTLTIKGITLDNLTVNAPDATIYLATDAGTVLVESTASNSFHIFSKVTNLTINKGRAVVEEGAIVTNLKAAPSLEATVKVVIEEEATVTNLEANYQKNGNGTNDWIEVENNGTVGTAKLTVVAGDAEKTEVTTNVKVINGANATGTAVTEVAVDSTTATADQVELFVADDTNKVGTVYEKAAGSTAIVESVQNYYWGNEQAYATSFAGGDGTFADPYEISNAFELARLAYLVNSKDEYIQIQGKYFVLTDDIDLSGGAWMPIGAFSRAKDDTGAANYFSGSFDGQNHTISGLSDNDVEVYASQTMRNSTTPQLALKEAKEFTYGLFGSVRAATIKNVNLVNVDIDVAVIEISDTVTYFGDSVGALVGYAYGGITVDNVTVSGSVLGYDCVGGIIGRTYDGEVVVSNSTNSATVKSARQVSGVVGSITSGCTATFDNSFNNGTVTCAFIEDPALTQGDINKGYYRAAGIALYKAPKSNTNPQVTLSNGSANNGTVVNNAATRIEAAALTYTASNVTIDEGIGYYG